MAHERHPSRPTIAALLVAAFAMAAFAADDLPDAGHWTERKDMRNVRVMGSGDGAMKLIHNEWMTIKGGNIGPEIGIGRHLGPSGVQRVAGKQYDGDVARAKQVLADLDTCDPGAKEYEVAGFFWWQGDRDSHSAAPSSRYEKNLVHVIQQLRKDFDAPHAKFVCATLGQTLRGATDHGGQLLEAMLAVDGESGRYPEFQGHVATVYDHPLSQGGSSGGHYGGNAETYMNVGEAMGRAMVRLLAGR